LTKTITNPGTAGQNPYSYITGVTSAAYVTAVTLDFQPYNKMLIHILETGGAESMIYRIQGSVDGTNYVIIVAATNVAASGEEYETFTDAWRRLRVQVIDDSGHAAYRIMWQKKA